MKPEQISKVMSEMEALFIEYSMQHNSITSSGKPLEMQLSSIGELQRKQAKAATGIVVKHCHWAEALSTKLEDVCKLAIAARDMTLSVKPVDQPDAQQTPDA